MYTEKLKECKNDTARSNLLREELTKVLYKAIADHLGAENTVLTTDKIVTEDGVEFPKNTVIGCVGQTPNKDGHSVDILIETSIKVKAWNTSGKRTAVNFDDVLAAMAPAEEEQT